MVTSGVGVAENLARRPGYTRADARTVAIPQDDVR